jgi:hypothetical protein
MIPDTNPRKVFTFRRREESDDCVTVTGFIYFWLPEAIILRRFLFLRLRNLFDFLHKVIERTAALLKSRKIECHINSPYVRCMKV